MDGWGKGVIKYGEGNATRHTCIKQTERRRGIDLALTKDTLAQKGQVDADQRPERRTWSKGSCLH